MDLSIFRRLFHGFFRPHATDHIVGLTGFAYQIHRHNRVFCNSTALQQKYCVLIWNTQQAAYQRLRMRENFSELRPAVAHLHHRHTATLPIQHVNRSTLQHRFR